MIPTILVVDDEPAVTDLLAYNLRKAHYEVLIAADGPSALAQARAGQPDLIVLDLMLPGMDGFEVCRELRKTSAVPIIMLTAQGEEIDRVVGLELGADDYVVKPFSAREVAARVRAVLRRSASVGGAADVVGESTTIGAAAGSPDEDAVVHGPLHIDPRSRTVSVAGRPVTLTAKEYDLLLVLARAPRRVFSRRQLLELVWDSSPDFQDAATVTVHVGRIRQKLEADPEHPRWIETVWGVGYRFEPGPTAASGTGAPDVPVEESA